MRHPRPSILWSLAVGLVVTMLAGRVAAEDTRGIGVVEVRDRDGYVTGVELGQVLETTVTNYTRRSQTPQYGKLRDPLLDKGDFVFQVPSREERVPEVAHLLPDREVVFSSSIKDSANVQDFQDYPMRFPQGTFAGLAERRLASLGEQQPVASTPSETQVPVGVYDDKPGSVFKDCAFCPEMVVIPSGRFTMGSPAGEAGRFEAEDPRHEVSVGSFALGKNEVMFEEYDACVQDGGCPRSGGDEGWGRSKRPVINVSWEDAQEYVRWLSWKTGRSYRLPSEAEWEYAARAGTTTPFSFGRTISPEQANYDGNYSYEGGPKGRYLKKTVPVGSYPANAFGLHDMHGNVWEWVEDCWHDSYKGAPSDGSAWTIGGNCIRRVLRGGSWLDEPWDFRSAHRNRDGTGIRDDDIGFRVARILDR